MMEQKTVKQVKELKQPQIDKQASSQFYLKNALTLDSQRYQKNDVLISKDQNLLNSSICSRCQQQPISYQCKICKTQLCQACDQTVHKKNKFYQHKRIYLPLMESKNFIKIKISQVERNDQLQAFENNIVLLAINQKWNKIIYQVECKFEQLINKIKQKKEQIIMKLDKKKSLQVSSQIHKQNKIIGNRKNSCSQQSIKRSQISQKVQPSYAKIKPIQCQHADQLGRCLGKLELNINYFQELKTTIQKIDIKNVINKILCHSDQQCKKKMRNSMLLSFNEPANVLNPCNSSFIALNSPKHHHKLSKSIIVQEPITPLLKKLNQEQFQSPRLKINETKIRMLNKIKSQKVILKSKNSDISMVRHTQAKSKKYGIMI